MLEDESEFFKLIKVSFMQRRKTLINSIVNGGIVKSKEEAKQLFDDLDLDYNVRGETLTIEQFARMSNYLVAKKK